MKKALLISLLICPFILGQDLAKNDNKKGEDKKPVVVTSAELETKEIEEGRQILADTRNAQRRLQLAQKVIENPNADADAKLLAYEIRDVQAALVDEARTRGQKYLARVQARTGCEGCDVFDFESVTKTISKPAKK
jgi:hypothetical protein